MSDIVSKCEEAYNLIQRCQNNESALGEEKFNIHQIRYDLSALLCMLESVKNNNLASFASHIQHTLENRDAIGEIRLHKPGQKGWFI